MHRLAEPYVLAYVLLEEGPAMMTNIVECDPERLQIGDPVTVRFVASSDAGQLVPVFAPAATSDPR